MKIIDGEIEEIDTPIESIECPIQDYKSNGHFDYQEIKVVVTGEFWRCIAIGGLKGSLNPEAARKLAIALLKAARICVREEKKLAAV